MPLDRDAWRCALVGDPVADSTPVAFFMLDEPLPDDIARGLAARAAVLGAFARVPRYHACVSSTNDVAARLAEAGAPEGAWVLADEQTAGRGRRGRSWISPAGAGLYLSVVFRPAPTSLASPASSATLHTAVPMQDARATSLLTLMAGVAAATAVRAATGLAPTLKWPNDVVIEPAHVGRAGFGGEAGDREGERVAVPRRETESGASSQSGSIGAGFSRFRKLAGILAEASATGGDLQFVVMGIGINLTPAAYPPDVAARATSIEGELGRPADRAALLVELLSALADGRRALLEGRAHEVLQAWRRCAPSSAGRRVRWQAGGNASVGVTQGIDDGGALLVRTETGTERIIAGDVQWE